jgi:phosphohistidine phosphatase
MMNELNIDLDQLFIDQDLYTFSGTNVIDYVYALNEQWNKVVLVGHNPAFMETINHFSDARINHLRTAGLAKITFDSDQWSDVYKGGILMGQKNNNI